VNVVKMYESGLWQEILEQKEPFFKLALWLCC